MVPARAGTKVRSGLAGVRGRAEAVGEEVETVGGKGEGSSCLNPS